MKTPTCVTSTRLPEIAMADLSLDKWRPISVDKFLATLTDSAFYECDFYIPPESISVDLENGTNAIVWCTCVEVEHADDGSADIGVMSPELLVLSSIRDDVRRYLCFTRT
jgi:hypothetical protein